MRQNRIEREEALWLLHDASQLELMQRAHAVRQARHPGREVTFVVDTNPNYTNACITKCTFCSFYRKPGHPEVYTLSPEAVAEKAARAWEMGATTILLQGGHHPELPFQYYVDMINALKKAAPGLHLHLFSPAEIVHIATTSGLSRETVLKSFYDLGLRTMPGGGAEILVDTVRRKISPKKIDAVTWLDTMRLAHRVGIKTSATMTYGHVETEHDIIEHLVRLRELQDETGGFYAFIPWSFKPGNSPLSKRVPMTALPSYYVRIIALARLTLDNFPHIQASWFGEGWRAGQLALYAGADDFGGVLLEENVLFQAQHNVATTIESVTSTIRDAGFIPVQRNTFYEKLRTWEPSSSDKSEPVFERKADKGTHTEQVKRQAV